MIGLDTNVLVRYLVGDHPQQSRAARQLVEERCTEDSPAHIDKVVLAEIVWVLEGAYGYDRELVVEVLEHMLRAAELEFDDVEVTWRAFRAYRDQGVDLADALIVYANLEAGCEETFTFDRAMGRLGGAQVLDQTSQ